MKAMKSMTKSMTKSLFNWEDSYFGGYERVVYDHPYIYIPKEIDIDFKNTSGCSWYVADKLCRLFLLKVEKFDLYPMLFQDGKIIEKKTFAGETLRLYTINKKAKSDCVRLLGNMDSELGGLFKHFKDFLVKADFSINITKKDDKGKGKGEEESDSTELEQALKDAEVLKKLLSEVNVQQYLTTPGGTEAVSGSLKEKTKFVVMKKCDVACHYTAEQIRLANSLVNLLDISFEPREDKIENMLSGKMSPHKVSSAIAGDTHIYHKIEQDVSTRPFSVCVLGDESGSMKGGGGSKSMHRIQNELFKVLYYAFSQILPQSKMFFYGHSGGYEPEVRVYHELYNPNFEHTIDKQVDNSYNENYDGPVIENVYERVRQQTSDNIIFISISDGSPSGHRYGGIAAINGMKRVIEKCKRDGFVTMGIGLRHGLVTEIYNYHTVVEDMTELVQKVSSLTNRVVKTEFKD